MKGTKEKGNEVMNRWEERSKEFIGNFLELFGRDGRIVSRLILSGALRIGVLRIGEYMQMAKICIS